VIGKAHGFNGQADAPEHKRLERQPFDSAVQLRSAAACKKPQ